MRKSDADGHPRDHTEDVIAPKPRAAVDGHVAHSLFSFSSRHEHRVDEVSPAAADLPERSKDRFKEVSAVSGVPGW